MELIDEPCAQDVHHLEVQINEHNLQRTERRDYRPLALFVRDQQGGVLAGLSGEGTRRITRRS